MSNTITAFAGKSHYMERRIVATPLDNIADRLRISRIALGYTPTTIARLIGSPSSFWHNLEAGTRRISVDKALALKRATGLTLEWIYSGDFASLPAPLAAKIGPLLGGQRRDGSNG